MCERSDTVTVKGLFTRKLVGLLAFAIGVLAAGYPLHHSYQSQQNQLEVKVSDLEMKYAGLNKENEHLRYIQNLSVEFSMDPLIVTLVDQYSRQYLKKGTAEWRLLKTPEFLTYVMLSVIYAESKGNPGAIGDGGRARGLTQIWATTAKDYGNVSPEALLDPETNISYSFRHFHELLKKYKGNLALVLYAWNRGPGTVDKLILYGQAPENGYGLKVYQASLNSNRDYVLAN